MRWFVLFTLCFLYLQSVSFRMVSFRLPADAYVHLSCFISLRPGVSIGVRVRCYRSWQEQPVDGLPAGACHGPGQESRQRIRRLRQPARVDSKRDGACVVVVLSLLVVIVVLTAFLALLLLLRLLLLSMAIYDLAMLLSNGGKMYLLILCLIRTIV